MDPEKFLDFYSLETHRLFVDVSELIKHDAGTGIQRVTKSILNVWKVVPPHDFKVIPVYEKDGIYREASLFFTKDVKDKLDLINDNIVYGQKGDVFLGLDLNLTVVRNQQIFKEWSNRGVKICFIVHDILPVLLPDMFDEELSAAFASWLNTVLNISDKLICVSQSVANELNNYIYQKKLQYNNRLRISWNTHGADLKTINPEIDFSSTYLNVLRSLQAKPSFLQVGTLEPRKNHFQVLTAFESLWANGLDINLIFVGKKGWKVEKLVEKLHTHPEKGKHLYWLEGVNDDFLNVLYSASTCLIMPSIGEGFGLPLIESAKHDLPIIARDIPVFREVAGNCAFYFKGVTSEDIAEAIRQWLSLYRIGNFPKSSEMSWKTWEESAQQLLKILCE
jgi:glycosyltransferase involved in cell wall biosynthesis